MSIDKMCLLDSDSHGAVIGALKRSFSRSPMVRDFLRQYRREEVWIKKDGSRAKRPHVFYKCWQCGEEFSSNKVQVDHIQPVVPVNIPARHMSYDVILNRLFCDTSNLQILCKAHHKEKSDRENAQRKEWLTKNKFIVYETCNANSSERYIGVYECIDYDEVYLGDFRVDNAIDAHLGDRFYRQILFVTDCAAEAFEYESRFVIGGACLRPPFNEWVCLNNKQYYKSVNQMADSLGIDPYRCHYALINSKTNICTIDDKHIIPADFYDPGYQYHIKRSFIYCVELKKSFNSSQEAAVFLKRKDVERSSLAILRAARNGERLYKYSWTLQITSCPIANE